MWNERVLFVSARFRYRNVEFFISDGIDVQSDSSIKVCHPS